MFARSSLRELVPVHRALAQGRYETAFALLENAAVRQRTRQARAQYRLYLAAVYALYGETGVENGLLALAEARQIDPEVEGQDLYRALWWEFAALQGEGVTSVRRGVSELRATGDAVARYHAASALFTAGAHRHAVAFLDSLPEAELPAYLEWRRYSLAGLAHEQLGQFAEAAANFERSAEMSSGPDQQAERLALAGCLLELQRWDEAIATLAAIDDAQLEHRDDLVHKRYLAARVETERGNPNRALELLREARGLLDSLGPHEVAAEEGYWLLLSEGQVLGSVGRADEAVERFEEAVRVAPPDQLGHVLHELALALIETGDLEEAQEQLELLLVEADYPYRAEALADLADVHLRLGALPEAEATALEALELGATSTASLCLGQVAQEYYRLEEAVTWFERAAAATSPGDPLWVLTQQLLADVFAQLGPSHAERLQQHAAAALEYTDPGNEWYLPLRAYLETARAQLGGQRRIVN